MSGEPGESDPAPEQVSNEELERAMAEAIDEDGNDIALARATAAMSPEARRKAEESIRRWAEKARRSLHASDD